jgi:hypothetical protein
LREGRHLDARPHGGRDVERQAGGVEVAFAQRIGVALANPRLGVRIRGRTRADADALAVRLLLVASLSCRPPQQFVHQRGDFAGGGAVGRGLAASRPAATLSAKTMR